MNPDPDALRRVLMGVTPQPLPQSGGMVQNVPSLPPGPQVNLSPALLRQLARAQALRQRR